MEINPNPVHMRGSRNFGCPYYNDCLNQAAKLLWETWACFDCHLKRFRKVKEQQPIPSEDTAPYYTLSTDVQLEAKTEIF